jgi:two-component system, OmpR family, response regulator MprA
MKILVVDDERAVRDSLRRALELQGYQVDLAADGAEALARLEANGQPDAVILDILMPGIDGLEVCRRIREEGNEVPVLMLTARDAVGDRVAGLDVGADDYLVKPFDPRELVMRLDTLIRRARAVPGERPLTPRELEVLTLLAEGMTQTEIADRLEITSKTVATHIERILGKLGVRSRAQAVAMAYRETLVSISA